MTGVKKADTRDMAAGGGIAGKIRTGDSLNNFPGPWASGQMIYKGEYGVGGIIFSIFTNQKKSKYIALQNVVEDESGHGAAMGMPFGQWRNSIRASCKSAHAAAEEFVISEHNGLIKKTNLITEEKEAYLRLNFALNDWNPLVRYLNLPEEDIFPDISDKVKRWRILGEQRAVLRQRSHALQLRQMAELIPEERRQKILPAPVGHYTPPAHMVSVCEKIKNLPLINPYPRWNQNEGIMALFKIIEPLFANDLREEEFYALQKSQLKLFEDVAKFYWKWEYFFSAKSIGFSKNMLSFAILFISFKLRKSANQPDVTEALEKAESLLPLIIEKNGYYKKLYEKTISFDAYGFPIITDHYRVPQEFDIDSYKKSYPELFYHCRG
ncbi:MAG: hypothetical protein FWC51_03210 [Proteobacteria bacterium]|nr:hypothetical protein [Pseudomonadota bacterium]